MNDTLVPVATLPVGVRDVVTVGGWLAAAATTTLPVMSPCAVQKKSYVPALLNVQYPPQRRVPS